MPLSYDALEVPQEIREMFEGGDVFDNFMALQGEVFRDVPGRRTLRFEANGKSYFVKQHYGVGWREIFKNLFSLRLPILSAATEARAIRKLDGLGIPTTPLVAYGCRGANPASLQSFVVTQDLGDIISLETLCADWARHPPELRFKRRLLHAVAEMARKFHDNGMNHRDFYICHFCLDKERLIKGDTHLYLIDLHRVGIRPEIRPRDRMKDMAALYFSAMNIGLTRRDYLRFLKIYRQKPLREILNSETAFWKKVSRRAQFLFSKFHGRMPVDTFNK
ncbi:MAG TPA: lipopolysaccharide core heptose(I) kinase RfaP [Methylophilaceae bacterium]|nr:lipopolysaccharide core heptose(I) kinase RfaP [Methylophilaceae bacterium]